MAKVFIHDQTGNTYSGDNYGARLTINCPNGSVVRIVSGDTEYVATAENESAVFENLAHGIWEIIMSNGSQTATKTIDIAVDYEVTIDFFTATIVVDYPVGAVCECTDGVTVLTAPDTSGLWHCDVPNAGSWTVTVTNDSFTKSDTVDITYNGQYVDILLAFFTATINVVYPDGAICSCSKDGTMYSASDTTGNWSFVVHEEGEWLITVTDGIQTVLSSAYITYDGQSADISVEFFAATIEITYPVGAICTCTDGTTTFTAPNTTGSWTVVVPRIGTWAIKAVNDNRTTSQTIEIFEDGQRESVICSFFESYINVIYPANAFKVVMWYIDGYGTRVLIAVDSSGSGSCRFVATETGKYEVAAYRVAPYVGIESIRGDYHSSEVTIDSSGQTVAVTLTFNTVPEFTYTGTYKIVDDDGNEVTKTEGNWNIMFLTTGALKFTSLNGAKNGIDVFVQGGGGNGGNTFDIVAGGLEYASGGGGGGGGYRNTSFGVQVTDENPYAIEVGGSGGQSSAFGTSASGGNNGGTATDASTSTGGGEGGAGGSHGGKGGGVANTVENGKDGAYAFLGTSGVKYGPGGAGGYGYNGTNNGTGPFAYGGKDGGGDSGTNAAENSGGGGGGGCYTASGPTAVGLGGSGIVIIRNKR